MKAYTDIERSKKKLVKILPIESADMYYYTVNGDWEWFETPNFIQRRDDLDEHAMPAWSLAALLGILPYRINDTYNLKLGKLYANDGWYICYNSNVHGIDYTKYYVADSNFIDACYEMILELHKDKLS